MESLILQLEPNTVVAEKYRIDSVLFRGKFGTVWRATSLETQETVVMKCDVDNNLVLNETLALCHVGKSSICPNYISVEFDYNQWLVVMSFEGKDINAVLRDFPGHAFSRHNLLAYIVHSINALRQFHEMDFVHRDIKLDNFAIGVSQGKAPLILIDLGSAESVDRIGGIFHEPEECYKQAPQAPPVILLGGNWTDGCDLFLLALSILFAAGYACLPRWKNKSYEDRAERHVQRFGDLKNELEPEDQYLIPLLEVMFRESQKFAGFVDYDAIEEEVSALEGFNPDIKFDL